MMETFMKNFIESYSDMAKFSDVLSSFSISFFDNTFDISINNDIFREN